MKRTLIIPAAGLATRLRPVSSSASKAMVPVNGKPTISYIIDSVGKQFDDIRVVHGPHNADLVNYINRRYPSIKLCLQEKAKGPLHAIWSALNGNDFLSDSVVTVWLGDTIVTDYTPNAKYEIVVSPVPDYSRWCLVDSNNVYYDKPKERPPTENALVGIYTLGTLQEIYTHTEQIMLSDKTVGGEFQISQLLAKYTTMNQFQTKEWFDVGDLPSLYDSRARLLQNQTRPDNSISIRNNVITKRGDRCKGEILWYDTINKHFPEALPYIPQIYRSDYVSGEYEMGMCSGSSLQEIFAFEDLRDDTVEYVINKVLNAYDEAFQPQQLLGAYINVEYKSACQDIDKVFFEKFERRGALTMPWTHDETYKKHIRKVKEYHENDNQIFVDAISHGDFHTGNIIFDFNTGVVKFIDPRGIDASTNYFYSVYDMVKLYQSFYGDYIWIKSDCEVNQRVKTAALNTLDQWLNNNGYDVKFIKMMVPIFLGGILEFHSDRPDHQEKLLNKCMELINEN